MDWQSTWGTMEKENHWAILPLQKVNDQMTIWNFYPGFIRQSGLSEIQIAIFQKLIHDREPTIRDQC